MERSLQVKSKYLRYDKKAKKIGNLPGIFHIVINAWTSRLLAHVELILHDF